VGPTEAGEGEMAGSRRREAARARLNARRAESDSEVVDQAMQSVRDSVEQHDPPASDEEANRIVSEEMRQMRAEKRAKTFVTSPRTR
jgi:hypothetical protein